jgi:hypothetical protein
LASRRAIFVFPFSRKGHGFLPLPVSLLPAVVAAIAPGGADLKV